MNLQQIRYFIELARELHFWKTSEKMFITQSALSRQIMSLETELGVKLFERTNRSVRLTAAGDFLKAKFEVLIQEIDSANRYARLIANGDVGELKIGHPGSITDLLPKILGDFTQQYPSLMIQLNEVVGEGLEASLLNYDIDVGFKRDTTQNQDLSSQSVLEEALCLIVPEDHAIKGRSIPNLKRLSHERFILPSLRRGHVYSETLRKIFESNGYAPDIRFESEFGSMILGLVRRKMGVSLLPFSYSLGKPAGVRFIKTPYLTNVFILWRKTENNLIVRNFIDAVDQTAT